MKRGTEIKKKLGRPIKMQQHGKDVTVQFDPHHCIYCKYFLKNLNEQPCRDCLNVDAGRTRPLYTPKMKRGVKP
jgi:hypothetical protein